MPQMLAQQSKEQTGEIFPSGKAGYIPVANESFASINGKVRIGFEDSSGGNHEITAQWVSARYLPTFAENEPFYLTGTDGKRWSIYPNKRTSIGVQTGITQPEAKSLADHRSWCRIAYLKNGEPQTLLGQAQEVTAGSQGVYFLKVREELPISSGQKIKYKSTEMPLGSITYVEKFGSKKPILD